MKILLIDDDKINLRILREMLSGEHYDCVSAGDGVEGLEVLQQHSDIEVILLDRMMPNMDGMAFMQHFSKLPNAGDIRVIMQTAAVTDRNIIEGTGSGVYCYLTKPFTREVLLSVIDAAVEDMRIKTAV